MTYFHGGGHIAGEYVEDADGAGRSGDTGVFVTTEQGLAEVYASTTAGSTAWVYEVEPIGDVVAVAPLVGGPVISYRCARARIVRRFTVPNAKREAIREAVFHAAGIREVLP